VTEQCPSSVHDSNPLGSRILCVRLAALLTLLVVLLSCRTRVPEDATEAINLMSKYVQGGRYDAAIKLGQDWLNKHPNDTAHKGTMYGQIGLICLVKASKGAAGREEWIQKTVAYYDQSLSVSEKGSLHIELYDAGRGFEQAGDLSPANRCSYYTRAVRALEKEIPFIQGDSYSAYGATLPLAPLRQEHQQALERVKTKLVKAGCNTGPVNSSPQGSR